MVLTISATRRSITALIAAAVLGTIMLNAPVEARADHASLEEAVAAGVLDQEVALGVLAGSVQAIVRYDVSSIITEIGATPTDDRAATALARLRSGLRDRKAPVVAALGRGGRVLRDFAAVGTTLVQFDSADAILSVLNRPEVAGIRENLVATPTDAESGPLVKQPAAQSQGHVGQGIAVAVLDTGVDFTNAAFGCTAPAQPSTCKVVAARDIAPDDGVHDTGSFHGTNVAGVALSIAPGANIVALDVFGSTGTASSVDISAGIDWAIANASTYKIRAINLSLGGGAYAGSCSPDPGFAEARAAGIVPVVAAGNSGNAAAISWPACVPGAVSVGAVYDANVGGRTYSVCSDTSTAADRITCFSQSSATLSMLAPGALITAAGITMAGTSQASPHVAGAVAVLAGAVPAASAATLADAVAGTGPLITDPRNGLARNRLDVEAALNQVTGTTAATPAPSPSPTATPAPDTTPPQVFARFPAENATGVETGSAVTATFSEVVTGVSASTMVLRTKSTGATVVATVTYDATSRTATLKPSAHLAVGSSYSVTLTGGITDAAGNPLPITSWTFTTAMTAGDVTAPVVSSRAPLAGATNVATNSSMTATFNETVTGVSGMSVQLKSKATGALVTATVTYDATNRRAILKPSTQLNVSSSYTAYLSSAIQDAAGNPLLAVSWTFTTAATTSPTPTPTSFTDIASSPFRADIEWLAASGITSGCTATRFCPDTSVTRGQMASFLARNLALPAATRDFFRDDESSAHESDINRVAQAGITSGCDASQFCPTVTVTRAHMASFLSRAFGLPRTSRDYFVDDTGISHEANINRLAASAITGGCRSGQFCPTWSVTRGQMAAFLRRASTYTAP